MPTLDDAPIVPKITGLNVAEGDLIQIYDVSAQKPKTITMAELITAITELTPAE
jgi:hypothetical protein